jgi:hypothetical protein
LTPWHGQRELLAGHQRLGAGVLDGEPLMMLAESVSASCRILERTRSWMGGLVTGVVIVAHLKDGAGLAQGVGPTTVTRLDLGAIDGDGAGDGATVTAGPLGVHHQRLAGGHGRIL